MSRFRLLPSSLAWVLLLCWLAGCGAGGPSEPLAESADASTTFDYSQLVDAYMPPLEGGRLELAPPKDWVFSKAGSAYLVGFHPSGRTLNDLPRILISLQPSPYEDVQDLHPTNAPPVVQSIKESIPVDQLKNQPSMVGLGGRTWIEYVGLGRSRGRLVARQNLQTIVEGRLLQVRLEVADTQFDQHRHQGYAVAAAARFLQTPTETATFDPVDELDPSEEPESPDSKKGLNRRRVSWELSDFFPNPVAAPASIAFCWKSSKSEISMAGVAHSCGSVLILEISSNPSPRLR